MQENFVSEICDDIGVVDLITKQVSFTNYL